MTVVQPRSFPWRRRLVVLLVIIAAVFLVWLSFRPTAIEVDVATAERGVLRVTLDEEGETRVRDRYRISAPVSGAVLRIELEPGDAVRADQTIVATFQPAAPSLLDARAQAEAQAGFDAAQADLGLAEAELERALAERRFADAEQERIRQLAADGVVSDERLDAAELRAETAIKSATAADFAARTAAHRRDQAQARLRHGASSGPTSQPIAIRSPIDGVVLRRFRESAAVVPAGEPLVEVADPRRLEIVADFLSEDAVQIEAGRPVRIEQWGGDQALRGTVRRVEPSGFTKISALGVEEQRVNVIVDLEQPRETWDALGDRFHVEVRVVLWESDDVLKIPASALYRVDGEWAVFTIEAGLAKVQSVEMGWSNGVESEIRSGLSEGQTVIVHPSDAVTEGARVQPRDPEF